MEKLFSLSPVTNESIMGVLSKFYIICRITKEQDKQLNAAGLRSKMPMGWNEDEDSVFARYEAVGISVVRPNFSGK